MISSISKGINLDRKCIPSPRFGCGVAVKNKLRSGGVFEY